ncbi:MAG: CoA transferase subunit A [Acidobacteriia bacterium]|nr:CoA transferase subunit A [Terriglobia bacterium]
MNKVFASADQAVANIADGCSVMMGGFGLCGIPENLIAALVRRGARKLTTISNNVGVQGFGVGLLLRNGQIRKHIGTFMGDNQLLQELLARGEIELEVIPQGTFIERIRSAGAGIAAFYTPTGVGTVVEQGKEPRDFDGQRYLLETALRADFALVKAWKGDAHGNLVYRKTARNFNPEMAAAAKVTIAEVEQLVPVGELNPDQVHTPGIYVQRIIQGPSYEKLIEKRTVRRAS